MPRRSITDWLEEIGLQQFARLFAEQQIEFDDLAASREAWYDLNSEPSTVSVRLY